MTFFNAKKKDIASLGGTNSSPKRKEKKKREKAVHKNHLNIMVHYNFILFFQTSKKYQLFNSTITAHIARG